MTLVLILMQSVVKLFNRWYGIYESWEYTEYVDKLGLTNCGSKFTSYPWLACSTQSNNENCIINDGCVPPSSYKWDSDEYEYVCNSITNVSAQT